jgi:hypothetical protein
MTDATPNVNTVTVQIPRSLPAAIDRPREHVEAVLAQSLRETGDQGRTALAWAWALTGSRPAPVTLSLPAGHPPTRKEILAEADAEPEGSTAPPGVPSDYCDQLGEARRVLLWLTGESDEIPVDDANRGRLIGARDDYAHADAEIRHIRDRAQRGLDAVDLLDSGDPRGSTDPWRRSPEWMNATWLRAVRDLLDWVLGNRSTVPRARSRQSARQPLCDDVALAPRRTRLICASPELGRVERPIRRSWRIWGCCCRPASRLPD